jgi:hypothetical protein
VSDAINMAGLIAGIVTSTQGSHIVPDALASEGPLAFYERLEQGARMLSAIERASHEHAWESEGVFNYDVAEQLGVWIAGQVQRDRLFPADKQVAVRLVALTVQFFLVPESDEHRHAVVIASAIALRRWINPQEHP